MRINSMPIPLAVSVLTTAADSFGNPLPDGRHIYVEGYAEIEVEPDQMTVAVGLTATDENLASAKTIVDEKSRRLIDALRALDIRSEDIATTTLKIRPYRTSES